MAFCVLVCVWVSVLFDRLLKAHVNLCGGLVLLSDNQEVNMFSLLTVIVKATPTHTGN